MSVALRDVVLRAGRDDDADAFIAIVGGCWDEYPGCVTDIDGEAPELRALASHMAGKSGAVWAAEVDGVVVGLCAAWPHEAGVWEVGKMYVAAAHRGRGAAQLLLDAAEAYARNAGATEMRLFSDTRFDRAHAFYEKSSYVRVGGLRALGDRSNSIEFGYAKPLTGVVVRALDVAALGSAEGRLAALLKICVDTGASVSFLAPLDLAEARAFWHRAGSGVAGGRKTVLGAWVDGALLGSVTLDCDTPPNQPHRADLAKLLVHPGVRRSGVARALLMRAEQAAQGCGRTLLTLDTLAGSAAERLYRAMGWTEAGVIPGYALDETGAAFDTVLFYKRFEPA